MSGKQDQREIVEEQEINILEFLQVMAKRKMFIIKVCVAAMVLSVIYSLMQPNIYTATARILPPQKEGGGLSALLGQAGGLAGLAMGGLGGGSDLYVGILKSRSVADSVIKRLDLAKVFKSKNDDAARARLAAKVKVHAGKDGIISIYAEDRDPKRAALLANTFVEELGRTTVRLNLSKAGTERLFLEKRLEVVKADLKKAEDDLKYFAQQNKVVQVDSQARASIEGIARLKAELASREVQLSVLRTYQTDESAEVKAVQTAIKRLHGELSKLGGTGGGGDSIPSIGNVPGLGLEYARKSRELKIQEAVFEQLTKQYEMAKLTEAKDSSSFQVLDDAVVPDRKSRPKRAIIVMLSTVTAFFASAFWLFLQDYLAKMSDQDKILFENIKKNLFIIKPGSEG